MNSITKTLLTSLAVAVVFFYAGVKYNQSHAATLPTRSGTGQFQMMGARFNRGTMMGGGFLAGTILSKDSESITISLQGGGSKIVFVGTSTPVTKIVAGSVSDLSVGESVVVTGTANPDGSISARGIEQRPQFNGTNNNQ